MGRAVSTIPTDVSGTFPGVREIVAIPNPAAGADWSYTIPGAYWRRVVCGTAKFTASAAVAARNPVLNVTYEGTLVSSQPQANNPAAGQAWLLNIVTLFDTVFASATSFRDCLALPDKWWEPGTTISTTTTNIQAGDQWSAIFILFDCWDYGPRGEPLGQHDATPAEMLREERETALAAHHTHSTHTQGVTQ